MEEQDLHGVQPRDESERSRSAKALRRFDIAEMPDAGDARQRRARDEPLQRVAMGGRDQDIALAPDDMRRHVDAMQPLRQLRIVEPRLPGVFRRGGAVLVVGLLQLASFACQSPAQRVAASSPAKSSLPVSAAEPMNISPRFTPLTLMPAASTRVRLRICAVERIAIAIAIQPPSEWPTIWTRPFAERVEQIEIEVSEIADIVDPIRRVAMAEARMIGRDHGEMLARAAPARRSSPASPCTPCRNSSGSPAPSRRRKSFVPLTSTKVSFTNGFLPGRQGSA